MRNCDEIKLKGYGFADGVHWHWKDKEIAIIDESTGEIEWCVRKSTLPKEVIEAVKAKKPHDSAKWEIHVKRYNISATQGVIDVYIGDSLIASFNDDQSIGNDGKYHSKYTDEELGKFVYSALWNKFDQRLSARAKDVFYPNWHKDEESPKIYRDDGLYVKTPIGILHAYPAIDPDYPGIYIDLQRDGYKCEAPLVVLDFSHTEFPECKNKETAEKGVLVCRCWRDVRQEDYKERDRTIFTGYEEFFEKAKNVD